MPRGLAARIEQLEATKRDYGPGSARKTETLLASFRRQRFPDPRSLIRFHDALLFLRAFPHGPRVVRLSEELLAAIPSEVERLRNAGADMDLFDPEECSGIAGTVLHDTFTYEVARWLVGRYPAAVTAVWDVEDRGRQLSVSLPRFLPLLADDSLVEADTPYLAWLAKAAGGERQVLPWLLRRVDDVPLSKLEKTELYDALAIELRWELGRSRATRTFARGAVRRFFFHNAPLLRRNQVSLEAELGSPPPRLRRLSRQEGERILDMVREAVTVRYRELWGTTRGDPAHVYEAEVGRGVQIFLWGLPPEQRLPLRAYHAGFTLKNGVPINYIEGISLFDWMEVGFNTFYAYRDGETAWTYAKAIHALHRLTGVTCISVYPYQLGHGNEEAIRSGAFWFYRKLGFRPGRPGLLELTESEERKIARDPKYRTSARTLRRLAAGHVFYEFGEAKPGAWDRFSVRQLGLKVVRQMAGDFGGDLQKMRRAASARLARALGVNLGSFRPQEQRAFADLACVLALVPGVAQWPAGEKRALVDLVRAKVGPEETLYLRRLQRHERLREVLRRLGSHAAGG